MPNPVQAAAEGLPKIQSPALDTLSFIKKRQAKGGGFNYWADVPAGDSYIDDCETGVRLAEEFAAFIGKYPTVGNASILSLIVTDMLSNGATKGHTVGFLNTVNKYAAAGGYLAQTKEPVDEHPWATVRRLTTALSAALGACNDGRWFAQVMPPEPMKTTYFTGAYPMSPEGEIPSDRVTRLAWELAEALNEHEGGRFHARVYPSKQAGYAVMFAKTAADEREERS